MLFVRELSVSTSERGILLRNGDFQRFLVTKNKESVRAHLNASYRLRAAQLAMKDVRIPWIFSTRRVNSRITF